MSRKALTFEEKREKEIKSAYLSLVETNGHVRIAREPAELIEYGTTYVEWSMGRGVLPSEIGFAAYYGSLDGFYRKYLGGAVNPGIRDSVAKRISEWNAAVDYVKARIDAGAIEWSCLNPKSYQGLVNAKMAHKKEFAPVVQKQEVMHVDKIDFSKVRELALAMASESAIDVPSEEVKIVAYGGEE